VPPGIFNVQEWHWDFGDRPEGTLRWLYSSNRPVVIRNDNDQKYIRTIFDIDVP
jgi:hypothetical protein